MLNYGNSLRIKNESDSLCYSEIAFGKLYLKTRDCEICFDDEYDVFPDLVNVFHYLKNGECGQWIIYDEWDIAIAFKAPEERKDIVLFAVGFAEHPLSFTNEYLREDILRMLRDIFKALLTDKDFPHQYPCFDEHDDDICEQEQDKAEVQAEGNSALEDELYKAAFREDRIPLSSKGKELYQRYRTMLEECLN